MLHLISRSRFLWPSMVPPTQLFALGLLSRLWLLLRDGCALPLLHTIKNLTSLYTNVLVVYVYMYTGRIGEQGSGSLCHLELSSSRSYFSRYRLKDIVKEEERERLLNIRRVIPLLIQHVVYTVSSIIWLCIEFYSLLPSRWLSH